ncbi:MAG: hypothetical protein H6667_02675 [Ardenticatenaceae bacterium]|nr:hypothetical protein [Ardenticatenaceae bacterium]MCB9445645.1 hypothetical protein [Ardenticatenaceae bacterium]
MNQIISALSQIKLALEEFYTNYKDLALVLAGSLATLILVFLQRILYAIRNFIVWAGKKIGGSLAHQNFLDNYLNWMVVEHQDLNLTGIIGSGPKPKLEQVFISLSFSKELENHVEESQTLFSKLLKKLNSYGWYSRKKRIKVQTTKTVIFYQRRPFYKIQSFVERNDELVIALLMIFTVAFLLGFFFVLPGYYLFWNTATENFDLFFSGITSGIVIILLIIGYSEGLKAKNSALSLFSSVGLVIYGGVGMFLFIFRGISMKSIGIALIGAILSIIFLGIFYWNESRSKDEFAEQIHRLLTRSNNIAILGKPGAGKSTFVQFLALTFAQEKAGEKKLKRRGVVRKRLGIRKWYIPIWIPLRKVSKVLLERDADGNANLLLEVWRDKVLPSDIRADYPNKFFLKNLKKKRCIFLLDGLDEVANDEEFRTVVREIKGFSSRFAGNKFIITSRFSGWRGGISSTYQDVQVNDLTPRQVQNFIDDWYQAIEENRVFGGIETETPPEKAQRLRKARNRATELKNALQEVESIRSLAENPLLLSIICFVHYHKTLPRERFSLYQDCSNLLLLQWDSEKGLPVDDTDLTLKRKEAIMQEIAFALHAGKIGKESGGKETTSGEIIPIIEQKLRQFRLPIENARPLFEKLINRSGIIVSVEKYTERFSFSHLTFQEFYTAKFIFENQIDLLAHFTNESIERFAGWWREVVLLYVSMVRDSALPQ